MPFTRVNPGDPIQAHQLDQVIDALDGAAGAGQPIAMTALNDATNYALTVQNDEPTNSRALNVLKSDGTNLIRADATGVTLGSPLNLPTGSITSTYILDGGVQNVDLGPDVARANLLTNGGFEIWQRGNGPYTTNAAYAADRWSINIAGTDTLSVTRDTTNIDTGSVACAACTYGLGTGGGAYLIQKIEDYGQLVGRTVSVSMRVKTATANAVRLGLYNGSTWTYSNYHPGGGVYATLTATATIGAGATLVEVAPYLTASCTAYFDNACLVVGSQPANYVPGHPADELARCQRYYETIGISGLGSIVVSGYAGAGGQSVRSMLRWTRKPASPTVTKVGTWGLSNASGQPTLAGVDVDGAWLNVVSTGAGDCFAWNNTAGCFITVEANP